MRPIAVLLAALLLPNLALAQDDLLDRVERLEKRVARLERKPVDIERMLAAAQRGDEEARAYLRELRSRIEKALAPRPAPKPDPMVREVDELAETIKRRIRELEEIEIKLRAEQASKKPPDRITKLIAELSDPKCSVQVRYNAAVHLGDTKARRSVTALATALEKDDNNLVRRAAAWSLGQMGKASEPVVPKLIAQLSGDEVYVAYMCERALGEITTALIDKPVTFGLSPEMTPEQRLEVQRRWEEWWASYSERK